MTDQTANWHEAGCARDCSEQHTYTWGRCALAPESARPEPAISIGRVETMGDGHPGIVLREVPLSAWEGLITVGKWVSRGKSSALDADLDIAPCYPDATARFALGALHDAGLLDTLGDSMATQPDPEDTCRPVEIDGDIIRVHGAEELSDESQAALTEVVRAARRRMLNEQRAAMAKYPYEDGDVTVLGPEIFVDADGKVISWKGANFVPQNRLRLAHEARRRKEDMLDGIRRALCDVGLMEDDDPYGHADLEDVILTRCARAAPIRSSAGTKPRSA